MFHAFLCMVCPGPVTLIRVSIPEEVSCSPEENVRMQIQDICLEDVKY